MQKEILKKNKVAGNSKVEEKATKRNKVTRHSESKEKIENTNKNMFKVCFPNQQLIKCN